MTYRLSMCSFSLVLIPSHPTNLPKSRSYSESILLVTAKIVNSHDPSQDAPPIYVFLLSGPNTLPSHQAACINQEVTQNQFCS